MSSYQREPRRGLDIDHDGTFETRADVLLPILWSFSASKESVFSQPLHR